MVEDKCKSRTSSLVARTRKLRTPSPFLPPPPTPLSWPTGPMPAPGGCCPKPPPPPPLSMPPLMLPPIGPPGPPMLPPGPPMFELPPIFPLPPMLPPPMCPPPMPPMGMRLGLFGPPIAPMGTTPGMPPIPNPPIAAMSIELPGGGSEKRSLQHKHESWQYCREKFQSRESLPQSRPNINKLEAVHNFLLHMLFVSSKGH